MQAERPRFVYLCADRGIPLGGVKGASVHVAEFIHALREADFGVRTVAARYATDVLPDRTYTSLATYEEVFAPFFDAALLQQAERRTLREARDVLLNAGVAAELARLHHEQPIDYLYERYSLFSMAGRAFAAAAGLPYLLEINAPLVLEAEQFRELRSRDLAESVARYLFSSADHVLAVSRANADYVLSLAPQARVTVLPNGVDPRRFESCWARSQDRLKSDPPEFVIGFVGSVRPWHGVDRLLDAFGRFAEMDEPVRLRIVGDTGSLHEDLLRQCADLRILEKVEFTGAVPFDSIPDHLSGLDVVVAPYPALEKFYFSPLKIFEYMAAGLPIVASAIGQVGEVLEHDRTALLVPPGDSESLCRALQRLRKDKALRQRLGSAARAEAVAGHSWQARMVTLKAITSGLSQAGPGRIGAVHAR